MATDYGNTPGNGPLRSGGTAISLHTDKDAQLPSTRSATVDAQAPSLETVRDLWEGDEKVKEKTSKYLPQNTAEKSADYSKRLTRSVFFNYFRNTIEGLAGFVFRRDPVLGNDVPAEIAAELENVDLAGSHLDVWLYERLQDALTSGHNLIFVEFPNTGGTQSAGEEDPRRRPGAIRPYWVPIKKDQIVSFRTTVEHGVTYLTQLVIEEAIDVPDGAFGETNQIRYRVLYREKGVVGFRVLEIADDKTVREVDKGTYPTQDEIPVAEIVTSGRRGFLDSTPPLMPVAQLNIAHYQQWSDYAMSLHMTCVPLLFISGVSQPVDPRTQQPVQVEVGPNTTLVTNNPQATAVYVSHDGAALGSCRTALEDLKSDIGSLGLSMLAPQKRSAETAEAKRIDKGTTDSKLGVAARGLQDAVERALHFHARYKKLPDGGSITINRDFEQMVLSAEDINAWAALVEKGFPKKPVVEALKQGGRLAEDAVVDDIVRDWDGEEDARRELEDQERQTRAASLLGLSREKAA